MTRRLAPSIVLVSLVALSFGVIDALAGRVVVIQERDADVVVFEAYPGERNEIVIIPNTSTSLIVYENGAQGLVDSFSCETDEAAYCYLREGVRIEVRVLLRDEDDSFTSTLCPRTFSAVTVNGGKGADVLRVSGPGRNLLRGGRGADRMKRVKNACPSTPTRLAVTYSERKAGVTATLDGRANDGTPGENDQIGVGVREVIGGRGSDTLRGNSRLNILRGGRGADALSGRGGRDILLGNGGADTLTGGDGRDRLLGRAGSDTLRARDGSRDVVKGGLASDRARVDRLLDALFSIESLF